MEQRHTFEERIGLDTDQNRQGSIELVTVTTCLNEEGGSLGCIMNTGGCDARDFFQCFLNSETSGSECSAKLAKLADCVNKP